MKKTYRSYGRKRYLRRRRTTKKSNRPARKQQKAAMTWIRKKYTKVFTCDCEGGSDVYEQTVSLIGGVNTVGPVDTITLGKVNQNDNLKTDMGLYQFFRIRGVAFKLIFPQPTDVFSSPVQWTCAYSANEIIKPTILPERVQTLATYQTGSCSQAQTISRFYNTANALRRFGVQYCNTKEFLDGKFTLATGSELYGTQLQKNQGSSVNIKVYRQTPAESENTLARLQVTYYVTYKGNKGTGSLIA